VQAIDRESVCVKRPRKIARHKRPPGGRLTRRNNQAIHLKGHKAYSDAVLTNHWRGHGGAIAINEHEQHALCDFCSEVYDAWEKLQTRLEMGRHADNPLQLGLDYQ
jgi:hypothetical protein